MARLPAPAKMGKLPPATPSSRCHGRVKPLAWVAYAAPARWLRELGASAATLPLRLHRELSRVLPELGFAGPPPDPASPRDRLFDALAQAWRVLCPTGPALCIFDDLQWLHAAGLGWLFYLVAG